MTFANVLPAYRDTFTAAVASADFAVDVAGCDCTADDVRAIAALPGVTKVVPVFGINDIPILGPGGESAAFAWVLDDVDGGSAIPIGPNHVAAGAFDFGSPADPLVVLDRETAIAVGAAVGDEVRLRVNGRDLVLHVAAITGSAARFRGPSMTFGRFVIEALLPPEYRAMPYTELLIAGSIETNAVQRAFLGRKTIVYSKSEQLEILQGQIEVSQPVITVVSIAAMVALFGFALLLALFATERRRAYLRLLPALGASIGQVVRSFLVVEALPTGLAMGLGGVVALAVITNLYFAQISVNVSFPAAVAGGVAIASATVVAHTAVLALRRASLRP